MLLPSDILKTHIDVLTWIQASITQLPGESPIAARIRASTCALQLEKHLMVVREHKLISSIQKAGRPSPAHSSGLASSYPIMARSDVLASRKARLQVQPAALCSS